MRFKDLISVLVLSRSKLEEHDWGLGSRMKLSQPNVCSV